MGRYDITLRHLTRTGCRAFLAAVGAKGRLTFVETEFPTTRERRIDHLAVLESPDGGPTLLHVEFQAARDGNMADRMLEYYCDIRRWRRTQLRKRGDALPDRIVQKVVYVGAARWQPKATIRDPGVDFRF